MDNVTKYLTTRFPHISFNKNWELSCDTCFKLGQCEAIIKSLCYLPLTPEIRSRMLGVSLIKGAQATTAIEGNTLSEEEIARINSGTPLPQSRKYLEVEVKNILDMLNGIFDAVVNENKASLVTPELIKDFHKGVGKDLGEHFEAIPGQFRQNNVHVSNYVGPEYKHVNSIMRMFCDWLQAEFKFNCNEDIDFRTCVIEAIVAHVYIAWIHPFGDGNGRTARLLEFYLLLRGGLPNICSHILSNHYNQTRSEYYHQLALASQECSLTKFIEYAIQGLFDGLNEILWEAQRHQLDNAWKNYVYEVLDGIKNLNKPKRKRLCKLLTKINILDKYTPKTIVETSVDVGVVYANMSSRVIARDIECLIKLDLLCKEGDFYIANIKKLVSVLPERRSINE